LKDKTYEVTNISLLFYEKSTLQSMQILRVR